MLHLTVAQDGSGDYASVSEAVLAVPYELEAEIAIGPGVCREKLVCEKRCITLRGAGADQTILVWNDRTDTGLASLRRRAVPAQGLRPARPGSTNPPPPMRPRCWPAPGSAAARKFKKKGTSR